MSNSSLLNNNNNNGNCNGNERLWFGVICFQNLQQFQLDIVGFLAILGEGSVLANAQVASLSKITFLPRLLPAPQALMRPSRPSVLPHVKGFATAVKSGNHRDYINHIGDILVDGESLPPYAVRCVEIRKHDFEGEVKARAWGPLWWVAFLGFIETLVLLALSAWQEDGFGLLSVIALAGLSSLVGVGNKWKLYLPKRKQKHIITPPGDVVIRYPKGSFLVVQCNEDVARELYFAPENMYYLVSHSWKYRMISLVGTFLLMASVVCLSNASTYLQIGFAAAYMFLNAAYWIVAALPAKVHWDMSCYEVQDQKFDVDPIVKEKTYSGTRGIEKRFIDHNETFTQALWKVILATKDIDWVKRSAAAPQTEAWEAWLHDAKDQASSAKSHVQQIAGKDVKVWEVPDWDAQNELVKAMQTHKDPDKV